MSFKICSMSRRAPRLKKQLSEIKNADKGSWTETWNKPGKKADIANFPHPSRICLIGPPSTGKSFMCKHLLLRQRPMFQEVYVIHADADVTSEYLDIEPTMMLNEFPDIGFFDGKVKTLVCLDDIEYSNLSSEQTARMNKLIRYGSSHKNITLYMTNQSFFELPSLLRKMSNVFIIWKPRSSTEMKLIASRIGLKPECLEDIFMNICNDFRDSLCVDLHHESPAFLRKNIWEVIEEKDNQKVL